MSIPRVVLDADIIYSRVLHELIGRLAGGPRLFDLIWSEELLSEAEASLVKGKGLLPEVAGFWVGHMRREFPEAAPIRLRSQRGSSSARRSRRCLCRSSRARPVPGEAAGRWMSCWPRLSERTSLGSRLVCGHCLPLCRTA